MIEIIITLFGILGLFFVGGGIVLETFNKLPKNHKIFLGINFIGSIFLSINAYFTEAWIFFILNILLIITFIISYIKIRKFKNN